MKRWIAVVARSGVNTGAKVLTEDEIDFWYPNAQWQDFGYKRGAHITDHVSVDLFEVTS